MVYGHIAMAIFKVACSLLFHQGESSYRNYYKKTSEQGGMNHVNEN